jgi:hypothetical protein
MKDWPGGASVRVVQGKEARSALRMYDALAQIAAGMIEQLAQNPQLNVITHDLEIPDVGTMFLHVIRLSNPDWAPGIAIYTVQWPRKPTGNEFAAVESRLVELSKGEIRQSQEQLRRWGM